MSPVIRLTLLVLVAACSMNPLHAQVSVTTLGIPHVENFNTLISTGSATWADNSTISGWYHYRTGSGNTIVAATGSGNAGALYSFGAASSSERALGSIGSNNAAVGDIYWGIRVQNNSGTAVQSITVSYTGEQWRYSGATSPQTVDFSYQVGSTVTSLSAGSWTDVNALDFTSPVYSGTTGALNGNSLTNQSLLSTTFAVSLAAGDEIMLRWEDINHSGSDHGLAIDNLSIILLSTPLPVELTAFHAHRMDDIVLLHWRTETELNNLGFVVERRTGSSTEWQELSTVSGMGTRQTPTEYSWTDRSAPRHMDLQYRLRQIDRDGSFEYSPILTVYHEQELGLSFSLYPQPASTRTNLRCSVDAPTQIVFYLTDITGRQFLAPKELTLAAGSQVIPFDVGHLPRGQYFLNISTPVSRESFSLYLQ